MPNPTLNENIYKNISNYNDATQSMTVNGTILKTMILLVLVLVAGAYNWNLFVTGSADFAHSLMIIGAVVGFILVLIISFKQKTAPFLAPVYAVMEGLVLGGISARFEAEFAGIVSQAILGTFAVMFSMLALYISRVIKVTDKLRAIIISSTLAVALMYLVALVLSLFHVNMSFLYDSSALSIGISLLVIGIASFNFLLDFDTIERCVQNSLPKYFEWYCSFGLLVTLVWLYIEILKLLAKLDRR